MNEEKILALLSAHPKRNFPFVELAHKVDATGKKSKALKKLLKSLVQQGLIERSRGRLFRISRAGQTLQGHVFVDHQGRPHLIVGSNPKEKPIPILSGKDDDLEQDDQVVAELTAVGRRGRIHARVVEILDRPKTRYVGLFRRTGKTVVIELDLSSSASKRVTGSYRRSVADVMIPKGDTKGANDGDLVEYEFTERPKDYRSPPVGRLVQVIGRPGEREPEIKRLMIEHGLDTGFSQAVLEETGHIADEPTDDEMSGRRDVRHLPLVTIDGAEAKDFDDAIAADRVGKNHLRVYVAIADVSHYVQPGTALDQEALRRGTSTYLVDRVTPMLPEKLSNGVCSLNPKVNRLALMAEMVINQKGRIEETSFGPVVMRSVARLRYEEVASALEGSPPASCRPLMANLEKLSQAADWLLKARLRKGAIDLDIGEPKVVLSRQGHPTDVVKRPRNRAHRLVEQLMLLANEAVANYFVQQDMPTLYRVHEDPDPEKLDAFFQLCEELGLNVKTSRKPSPLEVSKLLARLNEHPLGSCLHGLLLRSLNQAHYDAEHHGHFGLASSQYLHFTSPIRRYPDLVVHRLLKAAVAEVDAPHAPKRLAEIARLSSDSERRAVRAERESIGLDRALIAEDHVGETYEATITGVQSFGLFATIDHPFIEGLVPVQSLPQDYYEPDVYGTMLLGKNLGKSYMLGDTITVEITSVNIARRQVEFGFVEAEGKKAPRTIQTKKPARRKSTRPKKKSSKRKRTRDR